MEYDVYIFNEVGVKNPYSLSGTRNFAYLTSLQLGKPPNTNTYYYSVKFKIENKSPGSTLVAVPFKACNSWRPRWGWLQFTVIKDIVVSNDTITINMYMQPIPKNEKYDYEGFISPTAIVHVFEVFDAHDQSSDFGMIIGNSTDYTKITDKSKLGFIVWSYSGIVTDGMTLPADLPNNASQLVFAHWDHDSAVVEYDYKSNRIVTNGHTLNMDIVITQGGFNLPAEVGEWGLFIFNDNGEPVLTHHYPPIKEPKYIRLGKKPSKVFDKSMVTLGQYGLFFKGATGASRRSYNAGLQMKSGAINIARGSYSGQQGDHHAGQGSEFYSECNTVVLNRDDYF
ncbi:DUF6453 family protein [Moellerella wisconsensis]|uniref:DUF6453 family protein n=1 Tax=Moellerella wisconsensis TaxID=158849 RepID=UPI00307676B8